MFKYITPEDIDRIMYDLLMNEYEALEGFAEDELKKAVTDICDIYYGHCMGIDNILEIALEFMTENRDA